jgi:hypothetical protein
MATLGGDIEFQGKDRLALRSRCSYVYRIIRDCSSSIVVFGHGARRERPHRLMFCKPQLTAMSGRTVTFTESGRGIAGSQHLT